MCDTPFKTPRAYNACQTPKFGYKSDSDQSTTSTNSEGTGFTGSSGDLSIVALFDDLMRLIKSRRDDKVEDAFLHFAEQAKSIFTQWQIATAECQRVQNLLDSRTHEFSELENKLRKARGMVDIEKRNTKRAEQERDALQQKIEQMSAMLTDDRYKIPDLAKEKIASFTKERYSENQGYLSAIPEINSTGSLLSDFSYSRSEDDLDSSKCYDKNWRKHRPSTGMAEPVAKKRRSSNKFVEINSGDTVRATTTVTVPKDGPITATSIIESVPVNEAEPQIANEFESAAPANLIFESWARESPRKLDRNNLKQHSFVQKTIVMPDTCGTCEKRIKFGKTVFKCKECKALCHFECKDKLPVPCIPVNNTPNQKNSMNIISDYTPTTPPMVPGIIVHCLNEIESRGLTELGLYRVPGPESQVKSLKEKFLRGKGAPCLNNYDIPIICGAVKDFLRSLNDTMTTYALRMEFVRAVQAKDKDDIAPALYQVIAQLPQPNRDTLAFIILHLQRVAESKACKMPLDSLAKIFGPTLVGYSSEDPDSQNFLDETHQQIRIMQHLLLLPAEYWSQFVNVNQNYNPGRLQQTPSTDSLLRPTTRFFSTPNRHNNLTYSNLKKKQRFFATPPSYQ